MAENNNSPSESFINAAIASLLGGISSIGRLMTATVISVIDIVKVYHSSLVPSVLANGQSVQMKHYEGLIKIDKKCLSPEFDYDFTNIRDDGMKYFRGNQPYERPCGSYRIALNVEDRFGRDNAWLGMTGTKSGEWPVSYHGTKNHHAKSIAEEGYALSKGERYLYGKGIYSTPEIAVAKRYAVNFKYDGDSYSCMLQNRVNPKYVKVIPKTVTSVGTYWLSNDNNAEVNEAELIRPYGICIFKN